MPGAWIAQPFTTNELVKEFDRAFKGIDRAFKQLQFFDALHRLVETNRSNILDVTNGHPLLSEELEPLMDDTRDDDGRPKKWHKPNVDVAKDGKHDDAGQAAKWHKTNVDDAKYEEHDYDGGVEAKWYNIYDEDAEHEERDERDTGGSVSVMVEVRRHG